MSKIPSENGRCSSKTLSIQALFIDGALCCALMALQLEQPTIFLQLCLLPEWQLLEFSL